MRLNAQKLLGFLFFVRIFVLVAAWLTIILLFPENKAQNFFNFTASAWNRWDAPHYLYLAQNWYTNSGDPANFIVFFPLYPLILKPFLFLTNISLVGTIISTFFFVTGAYFLYKVVAHDFSERIAFWTILSLAIFPTSYFFNAPYTESLFLFLFSLAMYLSQKEQWVWAGFFAGLATISRPLGFLITVAIVVEWWTSKRKNWKFLPIIILPTVLSALLYLLLNKNIYSNAFAFQKILNLNWQKHLTSPFLSIMDSWRLAFSGGMNNFTILVGWAESLSITIAWILIPFAFKYLKKSWAIFYALNIIVFSSTGFILSTPRYLLSVPPFFVILGLAQKNTWFRLFYRFASIFLLAGLSILFARGQWAF